ncbi:hypothetical protein GBV73_04455 [Thermococcus sp. 101 C5]|uniref:hypothetical protein n=1 Tax=Thermococcus sp. 101 C5 TaxID=2654197 RepID=UPI00128C09DF|nr:hypothetical protein [Thermococcus sp. 101 C5]MPW38953.1 hypothetical protein [Thermococcus sp. 101 C5]
MEKSTKAFLFLILATPLWALIAFGIEKLESMYGKIYPEILFFIYPTLIVASITTLFLWKLQISLPEFAVMASIAPLIVAIALSIVTMIEDLRSSPYHSDDPGFFVFLLFYLFPVVSFLLGAFIYYTIARLKGDAQ